MGGLQGFDPALLFQQSALLQNPLVANNPAALAVIAQQSFLSPDALAMQSVGCLTTSFTKKLYCSVCYEMEHLSPKDDTTPFCLLGEQIRQF